jgi:Flp pilus assembly protein TadD
VAPALYNSHDPSPSAYDLFSRGRAMLEGGHPHAAALLLGRAKLLEPEKASIREALGRALYMSGRAARARREFAKAVALNPADDYAHFALALACERTGQRQRALGHAKLANVMAPGVEHYRRTLARLNAAA